MNVSEEIFWRQQSFIQPDWYPHPITVIGAGAIGSHLVDTLANMGFKDITVYDDDVVEAHNISNQLYNLADIGKKKVEALKENINAKIGLEIKIKDVKMVPEDVAALSGILVLAVDNMEARKSLMLAAARNNLLYSVIEIRMAIDSGTIYCVDPSSKLEIRQWLAEWYPDEAAEESVCSLRAISTTAKLLSALAAGTVVLLAQKYARLAGKEISVKTENYTIANKARYCIDGTSYKYNW